MRKCNCTWLLVLLALATGLISLWLAMPEHKRTFWKTFFRQIPELPGRYLA